MLNQYYLLEAVATLSYGCTRNNIRRRVAEK